MSFQTPITIKEAIDNINEKRYLLPSIQRELVWGCDRIENLFDSIMQDYPFGSLLFWHVERGNTTNFQFYEFVRNYSQHGNSHNAKANVNGDADVTAVLDGQQRLTALYLGLKGSYAYKEPRKHWNNTAAFPKRRLYLNLLSPSGADDLRYDFRFLTEKESEERNEDRCWFQAGRILDFKKQAEVNKWLIANGLFNLAQEKATFANETLFKLREVIHDARLINFFLEKSESLDQVLQIFVRVNSAGVALNYSDLLLSIATAQWKIRDAREEIYQAVDELNGIGNGFNLSKDVVLKAALVLCDIKGIAFKVDNFNIKNMKEIEKQWDKIKGGLDAAVRLVASFGFNRDTLKANNAIIPIAYYLLKKGLPQDYCQHQKYKDDRSRVQKWLVLSLVKQVFGGHPDNVLIPIREVIAANTGAFPLSEIREKFKGTPKSLDFTADEIENLLESRWGEPYTFALLALLYPTLDFRNLFHIDHIHPRSGFTKARLMKKGVAEELVGSYMERPDLLPNLQLLEGLQNLQKSDKDFAAWFKETCKTPESQRDYRSKHYLPGDGFAITEFEAFFDQRKSLLRDKLKELLGAPSPVVE